MLDIPSQYMHYTSFWCVGFVKMSWLKQSWNKRFALFLTSWKQPLKQGMVSLFALCPSPLRQRPYGELQWQHGTTGIVRNLCNRFGTKNSLPWPIFVKDQLWFDFRKPSHFGWSLSGGSTAQGALATTTATATRTSKKEMGLLSKATTLHVQFLAITARLQRENAWFYALWRT